jgi:hypothetical protein
MTRNTATALIAAAGMALFAGSAQADTVKLSNYTYAPAKTVNTKIDLAGTSLDRTYSGGAGEFTGTWNGASFKTYCLDLYEFFHWNTSYTSYHLVNIDPGKAFDMGRLVTRYRAGVDTSLESAAFQIALWEITYENTGGYDLMSGSFKETAADGGVRTLAQSYLSDLGSFSAVHVAKLESRGYYDSYRRWVPGQQDFLVTTPVPEPSTYAMMFAGLLGIGLFARRRIQR